MITEQLETFPGHERFVFALLGMISHLDRFRSVLEIRDEASRDRTLDPALLDFALGVVSLSRTVHGIASAAAIDGETDAKDGVPVGLEARDPAPRWLR